MVDLRCLATLMVLTKGPDFQLLKSFSKMAVDSTLHPSLPTTSFSVLQYTIALTAIYSGTLTNNNFM